MIHVQAIRDAYATKEVSNAGFNWGSHNPADDKAKTSQFEPLEYLLHTGKENFKINQWELRTKSTVSHQNRVKPNTTNLRTNLKDPGTKNLEFQKGTFTTWQKPKIRQESSLIEETDTRQVNFAQVQNSRIFLYNKNSNNSQYFTNYSRIILVL